MNSDEKTGYSICDNCPNEDFSDESERANEYINDRNTIET